MDRGMEFVAIIVLLLVAGLLLLAVLPKGRRRTDVDTTPRSPRPPKDPATPVPGSAAQRHQHGKP
jgi:hypothetical protein